MNTLGYDLVELEDVIARNPTRQPVTFSNSGAGRNQYGYSSDGFESMLPRYPPKPPPTATTATNNNTFAQEDFGLLSSWDGNSWQNGHDNKNLDFGAGAALDEGELDQLIMHVQATAPPPPPPPPPHHATTAAPTRRQPKPQPMFTPPSEIIDLTDDDVIDLTSDNVNINNPRPMSMNDLQFLGPPRNAGYHQNAFRPPPSAGFPEGLRIIRHANGAVCFLFVTLPLCRIVSDEVGCTV